MDARNYAVIENTPGYLPEDEDPPTFDCYAEAVRHVADYYKQLCEEVNDDGSRRYDVSPIVNGQFSYVLAGDAGIAHLGRVVEIIKVEDDDV